MKYNFKKLIKPNIKVIGDEQLGDVIESLALFYDPALMNEYSKKLTLNTTLLSVFNACLKTRNMLFFKAYSSILHNRVKAYSVLEKQSIQWSRDTLNGFEAHVNYTMYNNLNSQYSNFLATIVSEIDNDEMYNKMRDIEGMIGADIQAGMTYDNVDMCVTLMNKDYDDMFAEIEDFLLDNTSNTDDGGYAIGVERYANIYNEIEGNLRAIKSITSNHYFHDNLQTDDIVRGMSKPITCGSALREDMLYHLHRGIKLLQKMVDVLDECNTYVDEDGSIPVSIPSHIMDSLKECLDVVREWLAQGIYRKTKWRLMVVGSQRFDRIPVLTIGVDNCITENICSVRSLLVEQLTSLYKAIPCIYGTLDDDNKLDVLKVLTDAIDVKIMHYAKSAMYSLYVADDVKVYSHTEDVYINAWTTEIYRALQDVVMSHNRTRELHDTYKDLKNYKNTNEN